MLYLVTEDLDLADSPVHQLAAATATVVGVDLQVQGDSLHSLLRGEVCAQAVHPNKHLQTGTGTVGAENLLRQQWEQRAGTKAGTKATPSSPPRASLAGEQLLSHLSLSPHTYSSSLTQPLHSQNPAWGYSC